VLVRRGLDQLRRDADLVAGAEHGAFYNRPSTFSSRAICGKGLRAPLYAITEVRGRLRVKRLICAKSVINSSGHAVGEVILGSGRQKGYPAEAPPRIGCPRAQGHANETSQTERIDKPRTIAKTTMAPRVGTAGVWAQPSQPDALDLMPTVCSRLDPQPQLLAFLWTGVCIDNRRRPQ